MKTLLKQQEEIKELWEKTEGATNLDLVNAVNQHINESIKSKTLMPIKYDIDRPSCDNDDCVKKAIPFDSIDGCFCPKCGKIHAF
jgi:hypothetical protein